MRVHSLSCVCLCVHRDDFALEKVEQESQAQALLDQTISMLQSIAQQNANVVDRMKLMQISRNMVGFSDTVPLCLVAPEEAACSLINTSSVLTQWLNCIVGNVVKFEKEEESVE